MGEAVPATPSCEARTMPLVVVVDPDTDACIILETFLRHAGYDVECAATAETGLAAIRSRGPAVIVGEHPIRAADGMTLCDVLRLDPSTASIPFLALTSRVAASEFECAARSHFRVLTKPADYQRVVIAVREAIGAQLS
jgi:CheY-like chemotaxis protein